MYRLYQTQQANLFLDHTKIIGIFLLWHYKYLYMTYLAPIKLEHIHHNYQIFMDMKHTRGVSKVRSQYPKISKGNELENSNKKILFVKKLSFFDVIAESIYSREQKYSDIV